MKTRFESKKLAKEDARILRMKNKPRRRQLSDHDAPKFKKGKEWRVLNTAEKIKDAVGKN